MERFGYIGVRHLYTQAFPFPTFGFFVFCWGVETSIVIA